MDSHNRRAVRPEVERIEARELLSALTTGLIGPAHPPVAVLLSQGLAAQEAQVPGTTTTSTSTSQPAKGNTFGVTTGPYVNGATSPLLTFGTPTPAEAAREKFSAGFGGPFYGGPGRFSDQAHIQYFRGLGSSSAFLHGDFNMAIVTPTDPNEPFYGDAVLEDKNVNSGGIIGLVLQGNRTDVDQFGRPTKMTFQADPNIYSGVFFIDTASGTVNIHYNNTNGSANVVFKGRVYTNGLTNPLVNSDLYSRSGRLHTRGGK
jgi:hypothetical protein